MSFAAYQKGCRHLFLHVNLVMYECVSKGFLDVLSFLEVHWDKGDYMDVILLIRINVDTIYFPHKVSFETVSNE